MAASTKAARRLGRNDMANTCEVLINLVNANKRKVLKLAMARNAWPKRDAARSRRYKFGSTHWYGRRGKGAA